MSQQFKHKKILIIGASGGLGQAYTRTFLQEGAELFLLGRDMKKLQSLAEKLNQKVCVAQADIRNEKSLQSVVPLIRSWSKEIDIILNATGKDVRKSLSAHSEEEIQQTLATNLLGSILSTKVFLPLLSDKKDSTIVHSGGFADGRLAFPYYSVDVASRAGIFSFVEAMNRELKQESKKYHLTYFCPNASYTPAEEAYLPIWNDMNIKISTVDEVCKALMKGLQKKKTVILMGAGSHILSKVNLLSPKLADCLILKKYSRILKYYLGNKI